MKRFLALLPAAVFLMSVAVPVFAYEYNGYEYRGYEYNGYEGGYDYNDYKYNGYAPTAVTAERKIVSGYIGEVTQVGYNYEVKIVDDTGHIVVAVTVPRVGGFVFDYTTGLPALLSDHYGNRVVAVINYDNAALAFAINAEGTLNLHTIEALKRDGDALHVTVEGGGLILSLNQYTDLLSWQTHQAIALDEFKVGDEVVFWYGFVATSYPAQTYPSRALRLVPAPVLEYEYGYPEAHELKGGIVRAGVNLYRVNLNAEAKGYTVVWNNALRRAELTRDGKVVTLAVDSAFFYVNGEAYTMTAPSLLEGGRLFAPADFFARL